MKIFTRFLCLILAFAVFQKILVSTIWAQESNFVTLPLAPIANWTNSQAYINPPTGEVTLGGVPFSIPQSSNSILTDIGHTSTHTLDINIENVSKIFVLINSYNTWEHHRGQYIGNIKAQSSGGQVHTTDIIVGTNIREWRHGNDAGFTVNWTTDPNSQEVFRGKPTHLGAPAVIDMLTINLPASFQENKTLSKITLNDTELVRPGIIWMGLTVEVVDGGESPEPFLRLPWDYEADSLTFTDAALAINSFFDHEYPLLSTSLTEPVEASGSIINAFGPNRIGESYSSHDGYDYGSAAGANLRDPVLAAAGGTATFSNSCGACGNMILIDHGNGYQTRYMHLHEEELITSEVGREVEVQAGDQIGLVGFSGNVVPPGERGAHIHFMVIEDKNEDGDFDDNIPDGLTDPFGWQSEEDDPWEDYEFDYAGQDSRTGNTSYYLWQQAIPDLSQNLTSNGGLFELDRFRLEFPQGATDRNLNLKIIPAPFAKPSNSLESLGSTIEVKARDLFGNAFNIFLNFFTIKVDFSSLDTSRFDPQSIAIYSSEDGVNWKREETTVDFIEKTASARLNHLSFFALMAQRIDTVAPTTTAILEGERGQENWLRTDTRLTLDAKDNQGGLGVDYTAYKIGSDFWKEYKEPIVFTEEGSYTVEFYSADKDENIEEIKSVNFNIDKTPPETFINANPKIIWPPNNKMVDIQISGFSRDDTEIAQNNFYVEDEYDQFEPQVNSFDQVIQLQASRKGKDKDGRKYTINVIATDLAGNSKESLVEVIVPHDQRDG